MKCLKMKKVNKQIDKFVDYLKFKQFDLNNYNKTKIILK